MNWLGPWKGAAFVTFFFVLLASLLFWLDFFRAYQTETRIIVMSRNPSAETAASNLGALAGTLSFYDRVLSQDEDLTDDVSGRSPLERRKAWQKKVQVAKDEKSEVLIVLGTESSLEMSRLWTSASAQTLMEVAAFYYNIRQDLDLRIIDGPFTKRIVDRPVAYVLTSLATALATTALFFFSLQSAPLIFQRFRSLRGEPHLSRPEDEGDDKTHYSIGDSVPLIDPKKFIPSRPRTLHFEEGAMRQEPPMPSPSTAYSKSSAPSNLPIAAEEGEIQNIFSENEGVPANLPFGEDNFLSFDPRESDAPRPESPEPAGPIMPETAEPTAEEYKARLNKLLANGNE